MSNLPARPEFSRSANARRDSGDERRPGPSPERPPHLRDDRDRDVRDHERGNRSRYPARSPPPRSSDTYITAAHDTYHTREYRSYDDARARDDRRRDRERDRDRDRDRDRHYRRQRVDDTWTPQNDYSPNRPQNRRVHPREYDRRGRDDYRRDRDWDRERSWDRDNQRTRDREHEWPPSPNYRAAPSSPRRDLHHHSPPRRGPPLYSSRGRRSASPRSVGSRRSSPLSRARPESHTRDMPRQRKSPLPRWPSPSPTRHSLHVPSPTRRCPSPETTGRQLHSDDLHMQPNEPEGADHAIEGVAALDDKLDVKGAGVPLAKGKDRCDNQDGELHVKAESPEPAGFPIECQEQLMQTVETVAVPSSEVTVTQPYLPTILRYEAKPRFSVGYESEYNRLEAHRAHAAAECRRCLKASRRALHELEMTTLDLRAATNRRELAEAHRKKAHHGQLGIDAESV